MTRMQASDARLVKFLYVLIRDRLPVGVVQSIVDDYCDFPADDPPLRPAVRYNLHLESYARELAGRLVLAHEGRDSRAAGR
jgi:hypothetical protein